MKPLGAMSHVMNASGLCLFGYLSTTYDLLQDSLTAVTGVEYTLNDLLLCGERIANMRHAFNVREGISFTKFKIPKRVYGFPPAVKGPTQGVTVDIDSLVREYLEEMAWNKDTTKPSRSKLVELGLSDVADVLGAI